MYSPLYHIYSWTMSGSGHLVFWLLGGGYWILISLSSTVFFIVSYFLATIICVSMLIYFFICGSKQESTNHWQETFVVLCLYSFLYLFLYCTTYSQSFLSHLTESKSYLYHLSLLLILILILIVILLMKGVLYSLAIWVVFITPDWYIVDLFHS